MARRGATPPEAGRPAGFRHWRWVRLSVLAAALAATWMLWGRPRADAPVKLTYELDLAQAASGRLVVTLVCEGDLPPQLGFFGSMIEQKIREKGQKLLA